MRKLSYVIAFFAVAATLTLNAISVKRPDWLVLSNPEVFHSKTTVQFGLTQRCERQVVVLPAPDGRRLAYTDYRCRPFPLRVPDECEDKNKAFCMAWTSAGYLDQLSIGFAALACLAIVFGVTTRSRRRRIWRAVAGLVAIHALLQIMTFAIVTHEYRTNSYPGFEQSRPGVGYILNGLSWFLAVLVTIGVTITGIAASRGHRWAAGNRAYTPIPR